MENPEHKYTNSLINESSPYLLQHAHNPVDWHPWNENTLKKAKEENKLILVSIGYSACHWCHVMEHESFEDEEVAKIMNENFICIKIDREERPDVDQVYMDAVQIISGRGGWPLNCFALPDGKPFWGATYFQRDQWVGILENIVLLSQTQLKKLEQQAEDIFAGISKTSFINLSANEISEYKISDTDEMAYILGNRIDRENGGFQGAPKFPMPNNFLFLLKYYFYSKNPEAKELVELTLDKMAKGGIYDQIGGGFARYSVDDHWHVPHFEKMLYDNAQLVSLYSEAFKASKNNSFEKVIKETLEFVQGELTSPEGGFYSALDADSEGVEGKYYVWQKEEFDKIVGDKSEILSAYFGMSEDAYWEDGNNVLIKNQSITDLAIKYQRSHEEVVQIIEEGKRKLFKERENRIRPGLDDKILTSWNALMLNGFVDAFFATKKNQYLEVAISNGEFLLKNLKQSDSGLYHNYKNETATIPGFLDDYAFVIKAFINLYQATFDEIWLIEARNFADYVFEHFYEKQSGMFYYTSDKGTDVIARKIEITDNVIPASNSSLANSLLKLGLYFEDMKYRQTAERMLSNVSEKLKEYPSAFSNWGMLFLKFVYSYSTFVVSGPEAKQKAKEVQNHYLPNVLVAGSQKGSLLPIFKNRYVANETLIYVCIGNECKLPVKTVNEAIDIFEREK